MRLIYNGIDLEFVAVVEHDADAPPGKNGKPLYCTTRVEVAVTGAPPCDAETEE
jgi:hypothetical protein